MIWTSLEIQFRKTRLLFFFIKVAFFQPSKEIQFFFTIINSSTTVILSYCHILCQYRLTVDISPRKVESILYDDLKNIYIYIYKNENKIKNKDIPTTPRV